jgi:hypothetical protein
MGNRFLSKDRMCRPVLLRRSRPVCTLRKGLVGGLSPASLRLGIHSSRHRNRRTLRLMLSEQQGHCSLSLVHFFEYGRWGSPEESSVEGQRLTAEDQLFGC